MTDTQRSWAAILALLADNTAGQISPQDLRDALLTLRSGHGHQYVSTPGAIAFANTVDFVEANAAAVWALASGSPSFDLFSLGGGNGRLTYIGAAPVMAHVTATFTIDSAGNNQRVLFRIGKNGTTFPSSESLIDTGTGGGTEAGSSHYIGTVSPGEYFSLFIRNSSSTNGFTLDRGSVQVLTRAL